MDDLQRRLEELQRIKGQNKIQNSGKATTVTTLKKESPLPETKPRKAFPLYLITIFVGTIASILLSNLYVCLIRKVEHILFSTTGINRPLTNAIIFGVIGFLSAIFCAKVCSEDYINDKDILFNIVACSLLAILIPAICALVWILMEFIAWIIYTIFLAAGIVWFIICALLMIFTLPW